MEEGDEKPSDDIKTADIDLIKSFLSSDALNVLHNPPEPVPAPSAIKCFFCFKDLQYSPQIISGFREEGLEGNRHLKSYSPL